MLAISRPNFLALQVRQRRAGNDPKRVIDSPVPKRPTGRQIADLEWALGIGLTRFVRSPAGAMLDRLRMAAGIRVAVRDMWRRNARIVAEPWSPGAEGARIEPLSVVYCRAAHGGGEPSYEPSFEDLHRFGRVSRALTRMPARLSAVLSAYHGDEGARWGRQSAAKRVYAVFPLTPTGRRWADRLRSDAIAAGYDSALLLDSERLANEADGSLTDIGRARLERVTREAIELLTIAHGAYAEAVERR